MSDAVDLDAIREHYSKALEKYGTTSEGVGWKSVERQEIRFEQLARSFAPGDEFSVLDVGCGYGAFYDYLRKTRTNFDFLGVDLAEEMIIKAESLHRDSARCAFEVGTIPDRKFDYVVASGIFNVMRAPSRDHWESYVFDTMRVMHDRCHKAMACNFLTSYSNAERKEVGLYYADPGKILEFCITELSMNMTLIHHYNTWDFTVHVFKDT